MPDVALVHPELHRNRGGAEAVAAATIDALEADHDLTVFAFGDPDVEVLNHCFGSSISSRALSTVTPSPSLLSNLSARRPEGKFGLLESAVVVRTLLDHASEFDLVVSTKPELPLARSVQYVHHPVFFPPTTPDEGSRASTPDRAYRTLCRRLAGFDSSATYHPKRLLTNAAWTAGVLEATYDVPADVVHPPVRVGDFDGRPWDEREDGFVCVSKLVPDKRVHACIDVVGRLRERGHDVHLHVVGDGRGEYARRVREYCRRRDWLTCEGFVARDRLVSLLERHRYGIHGKRYEHFGITVAEMVAAGMLPFVPATGGQAETVGDADLLTYRDADEAVENAHALLSDPAHREVVRTLPDPERFAAGTFETRMRGIVREAL
ncbi:glycosyltransferase family 4 protein [Halomarina ordinaria]|uniref:Glycosyltransferase family 4 protein n=1 Tax=Halomarina ordinaria TaxID=3033939 RepID=A0ABD5U3N6_9EURY|nr:glycosyltransferase family 4 protein [Halomarina sp. PSRA2]